MIGYSDARLGVGCKMPKFFGQFLLERGAISREMLLSAMADRREITKPLCSLAIEKKCFSPEQLDELDEERRRTGRKFMTLAALRGAVTFGQLEMLNECPCESWQYLGEALANAGHLRLVQLDRLYDEFGKERQRTQIVPIPELELARVARKEVVLPVLKITVDLFLHYARQLVRIVAVDRVRDLPEATTHVFTQKVLGHAAFCYVLALPAELALALAEFLVQEEFENVNETALDAVSEFLNIVVGNVCTQLGGDSSTSMTDPPQVMTRDMARHLLPEGAPVTVTLRTSKGDFRVQFFFDEQEQTGVGSTGGERGSV